MEKELSPMLKSLDNFNLTLIDKDNLKLALEMAFILGEKSQVEHFNEEDPTELIKKDEEQMVLTIFDKFNIPYPKSMQKTSD